MYESVDAWEPTAAEAAAYDAAQEQVNGHAAPEPPPPAEPRATGRAAIDEMVRYVRSNQCRPASREGFDRARLLLGEALAAVQHLDLGGCDTGPLFGQLVGKLKDAQAELASFGRYVLIVARGGTKRGGRPRKLPS
jgi:hypothetical protein